MTPENAFRLKMANAVLKNMHKNQAAIFMNNALNLIEANDNEVDPKVAAMSGSPNGPPEEFAAAASEWLDEIADRVRKSIVANQYAIAKANMAMTMAQNATLNALDAMAGKCQCTNQDPNIHMH